MIGKGMPETVENATADTADLVRPEFFNDLWGVLLHGLSAPTDKSEYIGRRIPEWCRSIGMGIN